MTSAAARLFVYGTLMPGQPRWPLLEPYAAGPPAAAIVRGRLWDTGRGFPALDPGEDDVPGVVVDLRPELRDDALASMDEVEGTARGLYRRSRVDVDGATAWTYLLADPGLRLRRIVSWPVADYPPGDGRP